jgi:predicted oxidoreductase
MTHDAGAIVIVIGAGLAGLTAAAELATVEREVTARDREMANRFSKDLQISALRGARSYLGDRLVRSLPRTACWNFALLALALPGHPPGGG